MAQMTNGVQTETTNGWGAQLLASGPKFMAAAALILIGAFIAARVFVGEFVQDGKIALALTAIACVGVALIPVLAAGVIWIIRETAKASVAGVSQQVSETNQLVKSSIDQNAAVMNALLALTQQQMNQRAAPMQLTAGTRAPRKFELGQFTDANSDGKDDDDMVEVWVRSGNQYKKIEHSFAMLDDLIRMPEPTRALWTHSNESYGVTANIVASIDGSPLTWEGNQYRWRVPHDQVMAWWQEAQKT